MDWISTNWSAKLPMDGMGQVIVALLLLLIAPQPGLLNNDDSDESPEAVAIDKEIEDAMENMQALFEFGSGISGKESRQISKAFVSSNAKNY